MLVLALSYAAMFTADQPAPDPFLVQEPRTPDVRAQSLEVRCGSDVLRIDDYGAQVPVTGGATIMWNGRPLREGNAEALSRDLTRPSAVYRLGAQCLPHNRGVWFQIFIGEMTYLSEQPPAQRVFQSGAAIIRNGAVERYSGLQMITEEQFWFR